MENITQQQAENGLMFALTVAHFDECGHWKGSVRDIKKHDDGTIVMILENGQHIVVYCKVTNG